MKFALLILLFPSIVFGQTVKFVVHEGLWGDHWKCFNGGYEVVIEFFKENITYPIEAIQNNWEGKVFIRFLGEKNGSVTRVTVYKSSGFEILDDEVKRVMRNSPKWIAPKINGKFVRSYTSLPFTFKLH